MGADQIAAVYALYSSASMLVLTLGHGTHGFTLDPSTGEFVLTHPNIRIPKRGAFSYNYQCLPRLHSVIFVGCLRT